MTKRRFPPGAFSSEFESVVRKVISEQPGPEMAALGRRGKFIYLVRDNIDSAGLEIFEEMARANTQNGYPDAASSLLLLNECLTPYIGKMLLRCGIWWAGVRHELYIDDANELLVHQATLPHPDPDDVKS